MQPEGGPSIDRLAGMHSRTGVEAGNRANCLCLATKRTGRATGGGESGGRLGQDCASSSTAGAHAHGCHARLHVRRPPRDGAGPHHGCARGAPLRRHRDPLGPAARSLPRRPRAALQAEPAFPVVGTAARCARQLRALRAGRAAAAGVPPAGRLLAQAADGARRGVAEVVRPARRAHAGRGARCGA